MRARDMVGRFLLVFVLAGSAVGQNLLDGSESVAYDHLNDRYLVSSWGNGTIVAMEPDSTASVLYQSTNQVLGNHIANGVFYFSRGSSPAGVTAIDLTNDTELWTKYVGGTVQFDGMAADTSGYLYVIESLSERLFRINISDQSNSVFLGSGLPGRPQDVTFDPVNNRLLIVGYEIPCPVIAVSLPGGTITELVPDAPGGFDGITIDAAGHIYGSVYDMGLVWRWDSDGGNKRLASWGHVGPAGLDYNVYDDILAVPNFGGDRVDLVAMADDDGDDIPASQDNCPDLYNPEQVDSDGDSYGDLCDECTDLDGDGFGDPGFPANTCDVDNCPAVENPGQEDQDGDGFGDLCDNCPEISNPDQTDDNQDGVGDVCEGCCVGNVGDANGSGDDAPTIGDISTMIDAKFVSEDCTGKILCMTEADVNLSAEGEAGCDDITIGDISMLIDYLFITGPENFGSLPACP